jgi:16S rRNA (guanine966-N2)-methyltransferase
VQNRTGRPDARKPGALKAKPPELPLAKVYSDLQITDGKLRGKFFKINPSPKLRNTSRKLREIMFKIILRRVRGKRFLDICAGSGVVALEAISRGALLGTFVDRSAKMSSLIRSNMAAMEVKSGHGEVFEIEAVPFLKQMEKRRRVWDVVYFGAPFDTNYDEALEYFGRGVCIESKGMLIIEHHSEMFFPEKIGRLRRWRVVVEDDSALSFYEKV